MRNKFPLFVGLVIMILLNEEAVSFYYKTTPLPEGRQMYGTAVLGDYLYVIGGNTKNGYETSVLKARILPDGALENWTPTTPLPHSRAYIANTTMVLHDVIYVIGGYDGTKDTNKQTILWSRPRPDGELSPWRESPPFPGEGIDCSVVVSTPGHIHLIGGYTQKDQPTKIVWTAVINDQGDFVRWEAGTPLPVPLWFHNAGVVGGRVWVWGGLTTPQNTSVNPLIYSTPILADGRLGQWRIEPFQLPKPFYRAACTASGPFLISFCPSYAGGTESNDVWYAELTDKGLSPWQGLNTDLSMKLFIGVATDFRRGFVFLPGGRIRKLELLALDNTVYYFYLAKKAYERKPEVTPVREVAQVAPTITTPDEVSNLPPLSYLYLRLTPPEALAGFIPYEIARLQSLRLKMPLVVYYHSPRANPCKQQREALQKINFSTYKDRILFAWVDTTLLPQLVQQMGVFRVPCWIFFDSAGKELKRKIGILQESEFEGWLFSG